MPVLKIYKDGEWQNISGGSATDMTDKIYKQNDEPIDAPDGSLWVDMDEEGGGGSGNIDLSGYATKDDLKNFITEIPSEYVTDSELTSYAKKSEIPDISAFQTAEQVSLLINEALGVIENGSY